MSDDEARHRLVTDSGGRPVKEPWLVRIKAGRRLKAWNKNVVAFGLASGFVEPLESTSIHMIMSACVRLAHLFPFTGIKQSMVDHYNEMSKSEIEHIRDFVCMHYYCTQRDDSAFWRHCSKMEIPESLRAASTCSARPVTSTRAKRAVPGRFVDRGVHGAEHRAGDLSSLRAHERQGSQGVHVEDPRAGRQMVNALPRHADFVRQYAAASANAWQ